MIILPIDIEVKPIPDNLQGRITADTPQEILYRVFIAIVHFLAGPPE